MTRFIRIAAIALLAAVPLVAPAAGQAPQDQDYISWANQAPLDDTGPASFVINLRDAEIQTLAEQVSDITGRSVLLDPTVRGEVTVFSSAPLTEAGVWELFQSVLRVNGFAAVPSGAVWRVVPQAAVRNGGVALDAGGAVYSQDLVTKLISLDNLSSEAAVRVLRPLVASFGYIEALPRPNALIVTDYAENVTRIEQLAAELDGDGGDDFTLVPLQNAPAGSVADILGQVLADTGVGPASRAPRIAVDERGNALIVRGEPDQIAEVRRLANSLDGPGGAAPITRVFRLRHSDALAVASVLQGVLGDGGGAVTNPVARSLAPGQFGSQNGYQGGSLGGSFGVSQSGGDQLSALAQQYGLATPGGGAQQGFGAGGGMASPAGFTTAGGVSIQPAIELNAIVVRGAPSVIAEIDALIAELDVRRPQVLIEAAIVEITGDAAEQLGVQLGFGAAAPPGSVAAVSFSDFGLSLRRILAILGEPAAVGLIDDGLSVGLSSEDEFGILVQALATSSSANLLSTPSITTLDNEPAEIVVGQNVPFRTGSFSAGNSLDPFTTIERQDVGLTLQVAPQVHDGDVVRLSVSQEVSSLLTGTFAGAADLITNRRSIVTTVLADDGETIVLGGLISNDQVTAESSVPVLGDIPVAGRLFSSEFETQTKRTLFVFLRPTILRDRRDSVAAAQARLRLVNGSEAARQDYLDTMLAPPVDGMRLEIEGIY
ncbi:MAG: type II secretion system secretin GspD [Maricaulaceae bacterium]|jgi:general secretion pathway protein D